MTDVNVYPIFNQRTPGIWDDFSRIRGAAVRDLGPNAWSDDVAREFHKTLAVELPYSFAFGAWDGGDMVGFVQGTIQKQQATINCLYVLPDYQSARIGGRLLHQAETAATIGAKWVDLVSLPRAENFYRRHGYTSPYKTNKYIKNIHGAGRCQVLPVFRTMGAVSRVCGQISRGYEMEFDSSIINRHHQPGVVYVDDAGQIRGYGLAHDGERRIHVDRGVSPFTAQRIERELNRIVTFTSFLERSR